MLNKSVSLLSKFLSNSLISKKTVAATLLSLCSVSAMAMNVVINNHDFDDQSVIDNGALSTIQGWQVESGIVGIFNPPDAVFTGEAGNGIHENTVYMINEAKVSQTLAATLLQDTQYTLTFDVGERSDVSMQNYTIVIKSNGSNLVFATNPEIPTQPGSFSRGELRFNSGSNFGDQITIEVITNGTGHVNLDNFTLTYNYRPNENIGYKVVGYGYVVDTDTTSQSCVISATLTAPNGVAYMNSTGPNCRCNEGSNLVLTNYFRDTISTSQYPVWVLRTHWFYNCVIAEGEFN